MQFVGYEDNKQNYEKNPQKRVLIIGSGNPC